MATISQMC